MQRRLRRLRANRTATLRDAQSGYPAMAQVILLLRCGFEPILYTPLLRRRR
jgi:hypothetical protein